MACLRHSPCGKQQMMQRVCSRQETIKIWFKQWKILKQVYRHDIRVHRDVFAAIAVISQLAIQNGNLCLVLSILMIDE